MLTEIISKQKLLQLLKELPENDRLILALSFYEGLSFEDIATVLNKPVVEITTSYHDILLKLKEEIK